MTSLLEAALAYLARGWPVFPCRPGRKEPLTEHGVKDATTDLAQIREWWTRWPDANIGIATGHPGPDVIDFDTTDGTADFPALTELRQAQVIDGHGDMVRTRSGGLHLYFTGTTQRNGSIRSRHIDFRGQGGYVIAPPSRVDADDKPGGTYERLGRQIDPQTEVDWRIVRDILDPPPPFQQPPRERAALNGSARAGDDFAAQTNWAEILSPHGWTLARDLGNGVRYWLRPGKTGHGISASTHDDGGLYVFTTSTDFEPEQPYTKFGAWTVLEGYGSDYGAAAAALRMQGYGEQPSAALSASPQELADARAVIAAQYTPVNWHQAWDNQPEDVEWLVAGFLEKGTVNALFAKPGTGKSLLALDIARGLAVDGKTVVYIDDENRVVDLVERLQDMGCSPGELDRLLVYSFAGLPPLDTNHGGEHLRAIAETRGACLVILDTTSRMVQGKENDADTFIQLYRCSLVPLKSQGITVLRLDHPGKDIDRGQRGSSAKDGDVDTVWRLSETGNRQQYKLDREKSRSNHGDISFVLTRPSDPLRHEWSVRAFQGSEVDEISARIIKVLDDANAPIKTGRETARKILSDAHDPATKAQVVAALSLRKILPGQVPGSQAGSALDHLPAAPALRGGQVGSTGPCQGCGVPIVRYGDNSEGHFCGDCKSRPWS